MEKKQPSAAQLQGLTNIWQSAVGVPSAVPGNWEADMKHLFDTGLGLQETLQYLYAEKPDLDVFLDWINTHSSTIVYDDAEDVPVLNEADLAHWNESGYVIIRNAVSEATCLAANKAIWAFLEADPDKPEGWYKPHPAKSGLMLVFTQHKALQAVRNSSRIRKAYEQLYGSTDIYPIVDKVSFNPPENDYYKFVGSGLHWDTSLELPIPERFQGLLYLNDVNETSGAFKCVPGFQNNISEWKAGLPPGTDLRTHALKTLQPVSIPANAGDFIIWHQALPHCASPNTGTHPRLVQYLTYLPAGYEDNRAWV